MGEKEERGEVGEKGRVKGKGRGGGWEQEVIREEREWQGGAGGGKAGAG